MMTMMSFPGVHPRIDGAHLVPVTSALAALNRREAAEQRRIARETVIAILG